MASVEGVFVGSTVSDSTQASADVSGVATGDVLIVVEGTNGAASPTSFSSSFSGLGASFSLIPGTAPSGQTATVQMWVGVNPSTSSGTITGAGAPSIGLNGRAITVYVLRGVDPESLLADSDVHTGNGTATATLSAPAHSVVIAAGYAATSANAISELDPATGWVVQSQPALRISNRWYRTASRVALGAGSHSASATRNGVSAASIVAVPVPVRHIATLTATTGGSVALGAPVNAAATLTATTGGSATLGVIRPGYTTEATLTVTTGGSATIGVIAPVFAEAVLTVTTGGSATLEAGPIQASVTLTATTGGTATLGGAVAPAVTLTATTGGTATVGVVAPAALSIALAVFFSAEGEVFGPGSMQYATALGSSPRTIDFDADGLDQWYVWTSTSVSTVEFTWSGPAATVSIYMVAEDMVGAFTEDDLSLLASGEDEVTASVGESVTYLVRVQANAPTTSSGTLSWTTTARDGTGDLAVEIPSSAVAEGGWLYIRVLNGTPETVIAVEVDGDPIDFEIEVDETGQAQMTILLTGVGVGSHTLELLDTSGKTVSESFSVVPQSGALDGGTSPSDVVLPAPSGSPVPRWIFYLPGNDPDPLTHNPSSMSSPHRERSYVTEHTTAPSGQQVIFEGQAIPVDWNVEGQVQTQEDYDLWETYLDLNARFYVIDHLERAWVVTLESLDWGERTGWSPMSVVDYKAKFTIWDGPFSLEAGSP